MQHCNPCWGLLCHPQLRHVVTCHAKVLPARPRAATAMLVVRCRYNWGVHRPDVALANYFFTQPLDPPLRCALDLPSANLEVRAASRCCQSLITSELDYKLLTHY